MWQCTVAVLGFSLPSQQPSRPDPSASPAPFWRRLEVTNNEPCRASCDANNDDECDGQNDELEWKLSCDQHPTTSCDQGCAYSPPSPLAPWRENGTYPAPPPSSPPDDDDDDNLFYALAVFFCVLLVILLCLACVWTSFQSEAEGTPGRLRVHYWCCCLVPFDDWAQKHRRVREAEDVPDGVPVVMAEPLPLPLPSDLKTLSF